jgi:predicted nucleic acid-binding protein
LGLILDSSVLIAAERGAQPVAMLLRTIKAATGPTEVMISAISVIEVAHGMWRANSQELADRRRIYLQEVFSAISVQSFTKEMGERAARIDAESRKAGIVIPLADLQIGVAALEPGYAVATHNARHFRMIPNLDVRQF